MTRHHTIKAVALAATIAAFPFAHAIAKPQINTPAPDFVGKTATGETVSLSDLKGEIVVLEWTNKDCPYVRKHYDTDNMQALQKESKSDHDVTWISVISSAPGTQGHLTPEQALANIDATDAAPDHLVLDPEGTIGKAYAAATTPHMYVIDAEGTLVYMGGIDDKPSTSMSTVASAKNYVLAALDDMAEGRQIANAVTRPYGCSVKYSN